MEPDRPTYEPEERLSQITPENLHQETNWGEPVGEEVW